MATRCGGVQAAKLAQSECACKDGILSRPTGRVGASRKFARSKVKARSRATRQYRMPALSPLDTPRAPQCRFDAIFAPVSPGIHLAFTLSGASKGRKFAR